MFVTSITDHCRFQLWQCHITGLNCQCFSFLDGEIRGVAKKWQPCHFGTAFPYGKDQSTVNQLNGNNPGHQTSYIYWI